MLSPDHKTRAKDINFKSLITFFLQAPEKKVKTTALLQRRRDYLRSK